MPAIFRPRRWRPLHAVARWLADVPVADPVERRHAPMLQIVLLLLAGMPTLLWTYRIGFSGLPWRPAETAGLAMSAVIVAVAVTALALVRRGHFQWAVRPLLAVIAVFVVLAYLHNGFDAQGYEQPLQVAWLVLAGLVVGRRALWMMFAVIVVAFACGIVVDIDKAARALEPSRFSVADRITSGVTATVIFLLIAIVVDRSVAALRTSLAEATRRGDALAQANASLVEAMSERDRIADQLVHARKIEAVGQLAAGVAHDFNHLLGLVLGHARRGLRVADADAMRAALEGVDAAARRATSVAQTVLGFSRLAPEQVTRFDVRDALREMLPVLVQLFDGRVRILLDTGDEPLVVAFDRDRFLLVVLNLAANARDAMAGEGVFAVRATRAREGGAAITFHDSGPGVPIALRERIFEPFFTTKASGHGTGLGLSLVADIVASRGGRITLDAADPDGASFVVVLPES